MGEFAVANVKVGMQVWEMKGVSSLEASTTIKGIVEEMTFCLFDILFLHM